MVIALVRLEHADQMSISTGPNNVANIPPEFDEDLVDIGFAVVVGRGVGVSGLQVDRHPVIGNSPASCLPGHP